MTRTRSYALALLLIPAFVSCTAVSRGIGGITANKYAKARSGVVWVAPPPQELEPPAPERKSIYISFQDITGSDLELDANRLLRDAARAEGWTLAANPEEAQYRLRARARFFGEVDPESGGAQVGEQMGWIAGAAVGVGTYALVANATDNWVAGAAAGGVAGGLVGLGVSNASRPREWALITDFVLEVRTESPVEFEVLSSSSTAATGTGGAQGPRSGESGSTNVSSGRSATVKQTSNYLPYGVRLSVWANQMNMSEDEATPHIEERFVKAVKSMLPM